MLTKKQSALFPDFSYLASILGVRRLKLGVKFITLLCRLLYKSSSFIDSCIVNMGRPVQHRNLLLHLMDLAMHLYLLLLKPDSCKHLLLELFFEHANDFLFMIFLSYQGTETFLYACTGQVSISNLFLCLCIDFLVALNIKEKLTVQLICLVVSVEHLFHFTDLAIDIAHFLDNFAAITVDTVQFVQGDRETSMESGVVLG